MAEQLICNQQVVGSTPTTSSKRGKIPEWPKGADCKSVGTAFGGSNPPLPTRKTVRKRAVFLLYFGGFGVVKTQRTREIPARTTVVLTLRFRVQARTLRYSVALLLTNPLSHRINRTKTCGFSFVFWWIQRCENTTHAGNPRANHRGADAPLYACKQARFAIPSLCSSRIPSHRINRAKTCGFSFVFRWISVVKTQRTREIPREPPWC